MHMFCLPSNSVHVSLSFRLQSCDYGYSRHSRQRLLRRDKLASCCCSTGRLERATRLPRSTRTTTSRYKHVLWWKAPGAGIASALHVVNSIKGIQDHYHGVSPPLIIFNSTEDENCVSVSSSCLLPSANYDADVERIYILILGPCGTTHPITPPRRSSKQ